MEGSSKKSYIFDKESNTVYVIVEEHSDDLVQQPSNNDGEVQKEVVDSNTETLNIEQLRVISEAINLASETKEIRPTEMCKSANLAIDTNCNNDQSIVVSGFSDTINVTQSKKRKQESPVKNFTSYKCKICGDAFLGKDNFVNHCTFHCGDKSDKTYKCLDCGKLFRRKPSKKASGRQRMPTRCKKCDDAFMLAVNERLEELRANIYYKSHLCELCGKAFTAPRRLKTHMLIHSGEKPFKCDKCPASFVRRDNLKSHSLVHSEEKPFKCDQCGATFRHKANLKTHYTTHTAETEFVPCQWCNGTFSVKAIKSHKCRSIPGPEYFVCKFCRRKFKGRQNLENHVRTHTSERPFKCSYCTATFSKQAHTIVHERLHTGDKPYKCDVCGKAFTHKSSFDHHMLQHTGEKPFKCEHCLSSFPTRKSLTKHLHIHDPSNEARTFKCDNCGGGFLRKRNLVIHLRACAGSNIERETSMITSV